jgi:hypothetical protein
MMIDQDIVACSPSSVYRVLQEAGLLDRHTPKVSSKGKGFVQPLMPHEHWHVDVSYINIAGTFYYLLMNDSYNSRPATLRIPDPRRRLALFNDT